MLPRHCGWRQSYSSLQCPSGYPRAWHWDPTASTMSCQCHGRDGKQRSPHPAPKFLLVSIPKGLPCSSNGKESACDTGDQGSIPELGRSSGKGNGNPLQYSCRENSMDRDFPVAQTVKNLPAVQETKVRSLGQEDPLEKGMATHSSILAWRMPKTEEPGGLQSMGLQKVRHD